MIQIFSTDSSREYKLDDFNNFVEESDANSNFWISVESPSEAEYEILRAKFNFDASTIADCLDPEHYPKMEDYEAYLFFVTFFLEVNKSQPEIYKTQELNAFLGPNYLITISEVPSHFLQTLKDRAVRSKRLLQNGPDFLLSEILDSLAESYIPVIDEFDNRIDYLEALIFRSTHPKTVDRIFQLKKQVMNLKKLLIPQQEMLFRISLQEHDLIKERNRLFLRNVFDHFSRLTGSMDSHRDLIVSLFEAYRSQASNRMNEVMKVLTIIATIILPAALSKIYFRIKFGNQELD
jgi:magnesium transporter